MSAGPPSAGRQFRAGEVLFSEGDAGGVMYVIQQGHVRLWKEIDGEPTTLADLSAGEFVGELPLVLGGTHTATATATTDTQCLSLDVGALEDMVTSESELAVHFIRGLAMRLAQSHRLLGIVGRRDARTRVGLAILRHAEIDGKTTDEGTVIPHRLSDIADEVAVSRSELGEISKHLLKKQLLRVKRNGIVVPDVSRLYDYVKSGDD